MVASYCNALFRGRNYRYNRELTKIMALVVEGEGISL